VRQADASAGAVDQVLKKYMQYASLWPLQWAVLLQGLTQAKDTERTVLMLRWMETNSIPPQPLRDAALRGRE
jgi:hypothetical protein